MPRLGLRSAGRAVEDSAKALADDLLLVEQRTGAALTHHFRLHARAASESLRRGDHPLPHLDDAIRDSTATARDSIQAAAAMAVESIRRELADVGNALSAHRAASAGSALAGARAQDLAEDGMLAFNSSVPGVRSQFSHFLRRQVMRHRDHEELQAHVFAERAVAGSGVGAWYRPPIWLQSQVRASTYAVVNNVRMLGIDGFNRAL